MKKQIIFYLFENGCMLTLGLFQNNVKMVKSLWNRNIKFYEDGDVMLRASTKINC